MAVVKFFEAIGKCEMVVRGFRQCGMVVARGDSGSVMCGGVARLPVLGVSALPILALH